MRLKDNFLCKLSTDCKRSEYLRQCHSCNSCDSCQFTTFSSFCTSANHCHDVHFTRFTAHSSRMLFCHHPGDHSTLMAFNKHITLVRYWELKQLITNDIFRGLKADHNLITCYENQVTIKQWERLSKIDEFDNDVVRKITGVDVAKLIKSDKVEVVVEGNSVWISRESAKALNLIKG